MNTMSFNEIFNLLQHGDEVERIEVKQASEAVGKSLQETICAFSNEPGLGGGYLLLGLVKNEHDSPRYEISGVKDPDKLQCEIVSLCRQNFSIKIRPIFEIISHSEGPMVLVYIPEAEPHQKPVYILNRGIEHGAFRRIGPSDLTCTREDRDMLYQLRSRKKYEEMPMEDATRKDLDKGAVEAYRKIRKEISPHAKELEWDDDDLLMALGAIVDVHGTLRPTVGGLILFGTELALRRCFPVDTRIDYIIIDGTEWVPQPDRRFHTVEVREALVLAIPRLISLIMRDVPMTFHLKPGEISRRDIPLIPEVIIREAICNAVMHRDYNCGQAMQILRYTNRIDFRNPGYSLKPLDQLGLPGSVTRNPKISFAMHDLNFAEAKGSGIRTMQDASRKANLTVPLFESDRGLNIFSLTLLTHHLFDEKDLAWLSRFKHCNLTDDEALALIVVREMGIITNAYYRNINRIDTLGASVHLRRLRDLGLLEQKGKGNATYYVPTSQLLTPQTNSQYGKLTPHISPLPGELTPHISPLPGELFRSAGMNALAALSLPEDLKKEIEKLKKRTTTQEKVKDLIKKLCALRPLMLGEIAAILLRNPKHVRETYINAMIQSRELEFLFPDQPNHPQQAYRTKK
jgi:ATP-dependent DNA helicase RecG